MSPTQTNHELIKNYHLALSLIKSNQRKLYWHDCQLGDISPARMKLTIKHAKQNYQLIKK